MFSRCHQQRMLVYTLTDLQSHSFVRTVRTTPTQLLDVLSPAMTVSCAQLCCVGWLSSCWTGVRFSGCAPRATCMWHFPTC
jgi:hypothetical protein